MPGEETTRPWEGEPETGSFGAWLRRQREVREISLREIAETSKISVRYLEALEQDRFDLLPAPLFAKGFLREYAKFVGLDPDEVVNYYLSANPQRVEEQARERTRKRSRRPISPAALLGVLVFVLAIAVALWFLAYRADRSEEQVPAMTPPPAPEVPTETGSGSAAAPASAPIVVSLDFHRKSWVEAFVDGERTVSEFRIQGESLRISADREIRLKLGNPQGVTIEVNGKPYPTERLTADETVTIDLASLGESQGSG